MSGHGVGDPGRCRRPLDRQRLCGPGRRTASRVGADERAGVRRGHARQPRVRRGAADAGRSDRLLPFPGDLRQHGQRELADSAVETLCHSRSRRGEVRFRRCGDQLRVQQPSGRPRRHLRGVAFYGCRADARGVRIPARQLSGVGGADTHRFEIRPGTGRRSLGIRPDYRRAQPRADQRGGGRRAHHADGPQPEHGGGYRGATARQGDPVPVVPAGSAGRLRARPGLSGDGRDLPQQSGAEGEGRRADRYGRQGGGGQHLPPGAQTQVGQRRGFLPLRGDSPRQPFERRPDTERHI